jgi:hypothetical protein
MNCSICKAEFEGAGYNPAPICDAPCCVDCDRTLVTPLRGARLVARDGAENVATFALLLARQRARVGSFEGASVKDTALMVAQALVANAVERLHAAAREREPARGL